MTKEAQAAKEEAQREAAERKSIPRDTTGKPVEQHHRSSLAEHLAGRKRWTRTVDMSAVLGRDLIGHDGTPLTRVCYRINSKADEDLAVAAAHAQVHRIAELAEQGKDAFRQDGDVLTDNKSIQALYRCCRDPENPERTLFPTPEWMRRELDTDTIAGLLNGYLECRARKNGVPWDVTDVSLDSTREMLVAARDTELPERLLAMFAREYLSTLLTLVCCRWHDERQRVCDVLKEALREDGGDLWRNEAEGLVEEWQAGEGDDQD
ncbi:MAG: hypothetical protein GWN58_42645 [Anaerolineae bacterium]|nr:hypothetical protein [Anaerolineae bacterium]